MSALKRAWNALWSRPKGDLQSAIKALDKLPPEYFGKKRATTKDLPNLKHKEKIKVAIDASVGDYLYKEIQKRGYEIVCRAKQAEKDESWMKRARASGALFIISPDLDIPSIIEKKNLPMVWIDLLFAGYTNPTLNSDMTKAEKHAIWSQYIHDRIQAKIKFLSKEFGVRRD